MFALLLGQPSFAQTTTWPADKPITLIVPYTAGGSVDFVARLVGQHLGARLKQTVVVENVGGAGGAIGVARAVRAPPDGYTLVMGPDSPIAIAGLVNPAAVKYDAMKDLIPVGLVNTAPMVLVARPGLPITSMQDLVKLASTQPGKLTYATSGIGTVLHLAMEIIKSRARIDVTHVPYRGGAQIITDLTGDQVDLAVLVSVSAAPSVASGRIKAIASTAAERLPTLPDVPALSESPGFKDFEIVAWTGLFAPAGTSPAIVDRLNSELNVVLASAEVRGKLQDQGAVPGSGSAADFGAFLRREQQRYERIVKDANIRE
ncbi:MAG TPA: tripartite tricarboxylate transporter substrate binding protein [Lautropia sp.]|nr:tripartite tricarboxylate transporter substrate binding protein [Lautropia sp.]